MLASLFLSYSWLLGWLSFAELSFVLPRLFKLSKFFLQLFWPAWFGLVCFGLVGWWGANYFAVFMDALYLVNDFDVDNFNRKQSGGESMR